MGILYAGVSGFSYPEWRGRFYPNGLPPAQMLAFYAQHLNGVEMNSSFYRTPESVVLRRWASQTPPGFVFCFKAHRGLTYSGDAFPKEELALDLAARLRELGDRLGPVLVQWPPTRQRDPGLLDRVLSCLGLSAAVEFRHQSWFCQEIYQVLRRHRAALVRTDEEKWPMAPAQKTAPLAYYRLRRDYELAQLEHWRQRLRAEVQDLDQVHVYFRHSPEAPQWARFMLD